MDQLGDGAAADGADVVGLVADAVEDGLAAVEDLLVAADPDGEVSGGRTAGSAADGRVEDLDAAGSGLFVDAADERGRAGAEVEVDLALTHALEDTVLAEADGLDLCGAWQRGKDDFR